MLTRRLLLQTSLATSVVAAHSTSPLLAATSNDQDLSILSLSDAQSNLNLGVTVGTLIGAGIGIAAYVALTRQAPTPLLGVFAAAGIGTTASLLTRCVSNYVDYRVAGAGGDIQVANQDVRSDIDREGQEFGRFADQLDEVIRKVDFLYESETIDLALYWQKKEEFAAKFPKDGNQEEKIRSNNSSSAYISSGQEMKISNLPEDNAQMEAKLRGCIAENQRVAKYVDRLEHSLARLES